MATSQPPTPADQELIERAAEAGHGVTARQLRRWRQEGLLPHRKVRGRGRARGVESRESEPTAAQLLALCDYGARFPRKSDRVAVSLWYDGWKVQPGRVRLSVVRLLEVVRRDAERNRIDGPSTDLEKMVGEQLAASWSDPAEIVGPRQLIRDARSDLAHIAAGGSLDEVQDELIAGYFQLSEVERQVPGLIDPARETDRVVALADLEGMATTVAGCGDSALERARTQLRGTYEAMKELARSELTQASLPSLFADFLRVFDSSWDTRDPAYDPLNLMIATATAIALETA